jgi:hypothetical protein
LPETSGEEADPSHDSAQRGKEDRDDLDRQQNRPRAGFGKRAIHAEDLDDVCDPADHGGDPQQNEATTEQGSKTIHSTTHNEISIQRKRGFEAPKCITETGISKYPVRKFYVYRLRLETSDAPFYIGKGTGSRIRAHFKPSELKAKSHKNAIIRKAIADGVKVLKEVIRADLTETEAFALEVELIASYGRADIGTGILANHTDGGDGSTGARHERTAEYRENVRRSRIGKKATKSARDNMSFKNWNRNAELWKRADELHAMYTGLDVKSSYFLGKSAGLKPQQVSRMVEKFKGGWNPLESPDWLTWRQAI